MVDIQPEPMAAPPSTPPVWTQPVFLTGILVGFLLLAIGLFFQAFPMMSFTISLLVVCCGLGIILGAFGSLAVINYKGFVVAGVAAIAIALLAMVKYVDREQWIRVSVVGDIKETDIELSGGSSSGETYPGANRGRSIDFYLIDPSLKQKYLSLIVSMRKNKATDQGALAEESEIIFECIPAMSIIPFVGRGQDLRWTFDVNKRRLSGVANVDDGIVNEGRSCDGEPRAASIENLFQPVLAFVSSLGPASANAQDSSVPTLLKDLTSDSTAVRRNARSALSLAGEQAIEPMMMNWAQNPTDYRVSLGTTVALAQALRDKKEDRSLFSAALSDDDLSRILNAANSDDRTLRIYATEFLFDLGSPRVLPIVSDAFQNATEEGKYNFTFILSGTTPDLSPPEKDSLKISLQKWRSGVGAETQKKIDALLEKLK